MSFFGLGKPQPSSAEKIAAIEQEMKLMASMHSRYVFSPLCIILCWSALIVSKMANPRLSAYRMIQMCTKKCLPTDYREGELNKGESVCLDRCASKFFEAQNVVSEQLNKESQMRGGGQGGGGFGFGG
jgi:import inner membrane translocase subunit TIM10